MLGLVEEMKQAARGQPELPATRLPAHVLFTSPGWEESPELWKFAEFPKLFNYLRCCKDLQIPLEWKGLVPSKMREATGDA